MSLDIEMTILQRDFKELKKKVHEMPNFNTESTDHINSNLADINLKLNEFGSKMDKLVEMLTPLLTMGHIKSDTPKTNTVNKEVSVDEMYIPSVKVTGKTSGKAMPQKTTTTNVSNILNAMDKIPENKSNGS